MRIAIMQPTFLPWVGYFALMERVDHFVLLDSVQFARRSWQQRNRIKTAQGELMITVPVKKKGRRDELICDVEVDNPQDWAARSLKSVHMAYKRAPYFDAFSQGFDHHIAVPSQLLADLNINLITWMAAAFGISTPVSRSSTLNVAGSKDELLVNICKIYGAEIYVSPPGSHNYIDNSDRFENAGITVEWHNYEPAVYPQLHGPFLPYMAAIDLLFNCGADGIEKIREGIV